MDLPTTKAYALPGNLSAGIQHGSWSKMLPEADRKASTTALNSHRKDIREELHYTAKDIEAVEEWVKRHVESTWHSLGTCSMAPREGNSIVKHGVLDERLNVHGVKGLKVADLSICPDNVGCKCSLHPCTPSFFFPFEKCGVMKKRKKKRWMLTHDARTQQATRTRLLCSSARRLLCSSPRISATPALIWT